MRAVQRWVRLSAVGFRHVLGMIKFDAMVGVGGNDPHALDHGVNRVCKPQ